MVKPFELSPGNPVNDATETRTERLSESDMLFGGCPNDPDDEDDPRWVEGWIDYVRRERGETTN